MGRSLALEFTWSKPKVFWRYALHAWIIHRRSVRVSFLISSPMLIKSSRERVDLPGENKIHLMALHLESCSLLSDLCWEWQEWGCAKVFHLCQHSNGAKLCVLRRVYSECEYNLLCPITALRYSNNITDC